MPFCTRCGAPVSEADAFCTNCGVSQPVLSHRPGAPVQAPSDVGGWLLLLVLGLLLGGPVSLVREILSGQSLGYPAPLYSFLVLGDGALVGIGVWAGFKLARRQKDAPGFTRKLMLVAMVWHAVMALVTMSFAPTVATFLLLAASANLTWHEYLRKSRRVALTYGC